MFLARDKLAQGADMSELTYPSLPVKNLEESFDIMSDVEDEWDQYFQELYITFDRSSVLIATQCVPLCRVTLRCCTVLDCGAHCG